MTLKEGIDHARDVATKNRRRVEDIYSQETATPEERAEATTCFECADEHAQLMFWLMELAQRRETDSWIPVKTRPMTTSEKAAALRLYGVDDLEDTEALAFDCPMPQDGQEILITTAYGVEIDICEIDIDPEYGFNAYGLENRGDWEGVIAWRPLPEPYKEEDV